MNDWELKQKRAIDRAREYQARIEASDHILATAKRAIKRRALIRATNVRTGVVDEQNTYRHNVRSWIAGHKKRCAAGRINVSYEVFRTGWYVVEVSRSGPGLADSSTTLWCSRSSTWESIHMAKAARDGYNFHYAKYLMTR